MSSTSKDGYTRRVWPDCVIWYIHKDDPEGVGHDFVIARFPFVPDYHLCEFVESDGEYVHDVHITERPLQQFKTLTQALAVLKVIVGSRP